MAKKKIPETETGLMLIPEKLAQLVITLRQEKILLDTDLAKLYGVATKRLNEAVKRNIDRFPSDFMFQLTENEADTLRSKIATPKKRGGRTYLPYAFTEQGIAMLSSVLRSPQAVQVNIAIMRTFVQFRKIMGSTALLAEKLERLEKKYDENFAHVFNHLRYLSAADEAPKRRIGFNTET